MKTNYNIAVAFGVAHGLNDFIAGYLLSYLSTHSSDWQINTLAFLGYTILAFGGQWPVGVLLDTTQQLKRLSFVAIIGMLLAVGFSSVNLFVAIFFSGIASAFTHVCGGTACYLTDRNNSFLSGLFTAPGVMGLIVGGILGAMTFSMGYLFLLLVPLSLLLFWLYRFNLPTYSAIQEQSDQSSTTSVALESHDFFMVFLLVAIAFRSLLWNMLHIMSFNNNKWLLGLGISAALGKLIGGWLTHKIDWKKYTFVSVIGAVLFLNIDKGNLILFCVGVALLQSAVPITLLLMQNHWKQQPAIASGLSLGIAVILAGIPTYIETFRQFQNNTFFFIFICVCFLLPNLWILKESKWKTTYGD